MSDFALHPRLAADCRLLADWPLCRVLLMNDRRFPWVILVPRREAVREVYQLSDKDQAQFWKESATLGRWLIQHFEGHKLNIGMLGNLVSQLHAHHIVRFESDVCWPNPVWGQGTPIPYEEGTPEDPFQAISDWAAGAFAR